MAKKYYVVFNGRKKGIFDSWDKCEFQTIGFRNARFKSYKTLEEAEAAYEAYGNETSADYFSGSSGELKQEKAGCGYISDSIAVDASCLGNPGLLEFRGVEIRTGNLIFNKGPFKKGTNNIGEFLAIVEAMKYIEAHGLSIPVYSDSSVAIGWVKKKKCNTTLRQSGKNILFGLIEAAVHYLNESDHQVKILKWETEKWGEIPADYDRK